ncbi:hypothetical protein IAD21_05605 [Abditibacteriota bacterium]|nr:hypothetical protein IAD21_05605 [Abditibacteriota bacterium]
MCAERFRKWGLGLLLLFVLPYALYVAIYERVSWRPRTFTAGGPVLELAFSPDGHTLAVGRWRYVPLSKTKTEESWNNCGALEMWNVRSHIPSLTLVWPDDEPVVRLAFSRKTNQLIYVNRTGDVKSFDSSTGKCRRIAHAVVDEYGGFDLSPDSKEFVVSSRWGIRFYDAQTGQLKRTLDKVRTGSVASLAYSPTGKVLYITTSDKNSDVTILDTQTGKPLGSILAGGDTLEMGDFSPDGKMLALYNGYAVLLYDIPSCKVAKKLYQGKSAIRVMVWSPDNTMLAVGDVDGRLNLWDMSSGKIARSLQGNRNYPIESIAFSPDSRIMASAASYPNTITLRRVE